MAVRPRRPRLIPGTLREQTSRNDPSLSCGPTPRNLVAKPLHATLGPSPPRPCEARGGSSPLIRTHDLGRFSGYSLPKRWRRHRSARRGPAPFALLRSIRPDHRNAMADGTALDRLIDRGRRKQPTRPRRESASVGGGRWLAERRRSGRSLGFLLESLFLKFGYVRLPAFTFAGDSLFGPLFLEVRIADRPGAGEIGWRYLFGWGGGGPGVRSNSVRRCVVLLPRGRGSERGLHGVLLRGCAARRLADDPARALPNGCFLLHGKPTPKPIAHERNPERAHPSETPHAAEEKHTLSLSSIRSRETRNPSPSCWRSWGSKHEGLCLF